MSRPLIEARSAPVQLYSKKDYQILFSKNPLLSDKDILPNEPGKFDRKKKFIIMRTDCLYLHLIRCCRESVKDEKSLTGHGSPFFPVFRVLFTEKKESV